MAWHDHACRSHTLVRIWPRAFLIVNKFQYERLFLSLNFCPARGEAPAGDDHAGHMHPSSRHLRGISQRGNTDGCRTVNMPGGCKRRGLGPPSRHDNVGRFYDFANHTGYAEMELIETKVLIDLARVMPVFMRN